MTEPSRYDQLNPLARALVDDHDELDLAEMLVKAQDELAALRAAARSYCPTCGRGDAAPTVEHWEQQKQRADRAEELAEQHARNTSTVARERESYRRAWKEEQQRRARAEAALARVQHLADEYPAGIDTALIHEALDTDAPAATEATERPHCPCNGVRFPGADNCRWCKCHRTPVPAATEATDTPKTRCDCPPTNAGLDLCTACPGRKKDAP